MPSDKDYADSIELVEAVMEWIGMRWTVSMIKQELRDYFGEDLSFMTVNFLIKAANKEIRKRFNISPQDYKGLQITFYESVIRKKEEKTKNQLIAAERLDKLFGLEHITSDDPEMVARKIREEIKAMEASMNIGVTDGEKQNSEHDGERKDDAGSNTKPVTDGGSNSAEDSKVIAGDGTKDEDFSKVVEGVEELDQEALKELGDLSEDDLKEFRKVRKKIRS